MQLPKKLPGMRMRPQARLKAGDAQARRRRRRRTDAQPKGQKRQVARRRKNGLTALTFCTLQKTTGNYDTKDDNSSNWHNQRTKDKKAVKTAKDKYLSATKDKIKNYKR